MFIKPMKVNWIAHKGFFPMLWCFCKHKQYCSSN